MKINQILEYIKNYHPDLGPDYNGCDGVKFGNTDQECTGIVTALVPTVNVIKKTAELGANLLFVHETVSYLTPDWPEWKADFDCKVYDRKVKLIKNNNIVLVRDHDHMHANKPDSIFYGVLKYLGWLPYLTKEQPIPFGYTVNFPQPRTLKQIGDELIEKIGLNGLRYVGNPDDQFSKLSFTGHLYPGAFIPAHYKDNGTWTDYATEIINSMQENDVHLIIPGETIDWTVLSYIRDGLQLGGKFSCINPGHFNFEELGARYAKDWISDLTMHKVPVTYVPSGDLWRYQLNGGEE